MPVPLRSPPPDSLRPLGGQASALRLHGAAPRAGRLPGCCQEPGRRLRAASAKICSLALKGSWDSMTERLVTMSSSWEPVCPQPAYGAGFRGGGASRDISGRGGQEPAARGATRLASGQYDWGVSGSELPREQWAEMCSQVCINRRVRKPLRDLLVTKRRTCRVENSAASRDAC